MDYRRVLLFASLRVLPIGLSFLITLLVTRFFSAENAGDYFYSFIIVSTFAALASLGLQQAMVRFLGAGSINAASNRRLLTAVLWSVSSVSLVVLVLYFGLPYYAEAVLNKSQLGAIFVAHVFALFGLVLSSLFAYAFQGVRRPLLTVLFLGFVANLVFFSTVLALYFFSSNSVSIVQLAWLFTLCNFLSGLSAAYLWYRQDGACNVAVSWFDAELFDCALPLWLSQLMGLLLKHGGLIIAGIYVSSSDIALLSVSLRTAELLTLLLVAVTLFASPEYARLWADNKKGELSSLVRSNIAFLGGFGLLAALVLIVFAEQILFLFGEQYTAAAPLLMILAVGHFLSMTFASTVTALNMTGHEREVTRSTVISVGVSLPLTVFLTRQFSIEGAAVSSAFAITFSGLLCVNSYRKQFGHWPWQVLKH